MSRLSMKARSPSSMWSRSLTSSSRSASRRLSNWSCNRRLPSWYRPATGPSLYRGGMPTPPRSVKIGENERGGWSSERPRRPGEPERPPRQADVSVRGRVLAPSDRIRYAPGSLLHRPVRRRGDARGVPRPRARGHQRAALDGRACAGCSRAGSPEEQLDEKARALLDATAAKRLGAGQTVVIALEGFDAAERERYVRAGALQPPPAPPRARRGRQGQGRPRRTARRSTPCAPRSTRASSARRASSPPCASAAARSTSSSGSSSRRRRPTTS